MTYDYFANGWLQKVNHNGSMIAEYSYDEAGNRTRQRNVNGTYTDYDYADNDPRYMMDSITHYKMAGANPVPATDPKLMDPIVYTRDNAGNPMSMTDSIGTWQYGYDANNRLTTAIPPNPIPEQPAGGPYEYDWVGNRVRPPRDPNPQSNTNKMVYNAADQLTSWPGMHTYTYCGDGSLKEEKNAAGTQVMKSYAYTHDGLLAEADFDFSGPTQSRYLKNVWDADRNRVGFEVGTKVHGDPDIYSSESSHTFVYDTTAGIPAAVQDDGDYNVREPDGSLVARVDGVKGIRYFKFDQLGSTRLLTDSGGAVTDEYAYDAYGALLAHNRRADSVDQPYQYVGQLGYYAHHQEPRYGLTELGVRFYAPEIGSFTQHGSPYGYAGGNPCVNTQPSGQKKPGKPYDTCVKSCTNDDLVVDMMWPNGMDKVVGVIAGLCPGGWISGAIAGIVGGEVGEKIDDRDKREAADKVCKVFCSERVKRKRGWDFNDFRGWYEKYYKNYQCGVTPPDYDPDCYKLDEPYRSRCMGGEVPPPGY